MSYVIYKASRAPRSKSYSGPAWDLAGIRHLYRETYDSEGEAWRMVRKLTAVNPVGFKVAAVEEVKP